MDDEISLYGREAIEAHLKQCPSCMQSYTEMLKTRETLQAMDHPCSEDKLQAMKESIMVGKKYAPMKKPFWQRQIRWTAAAGWALFFGLGALLAGRGLGNSGNGATMVDIHQMNDSSHFTLDSDKSPQLIFSEDLAGETVVDLKDTAITYMGESELVHYVSFEGGR